MNNQSKPTSDGINQNTLLSLKETVSQNWQRIFDGSQNDKTRSGLVANDFIKLIKIYHRTQHSPKFYAAELNMSKSNLRKICQSSIGVSPTSCIYARMMLEACALLEDARRSIREIATDLGFNDPIYFSRFFKKQGGIPPDAYRRIASKIGLIPELSYFFPELCKIFPESSYT